MSEYPFPYNEREIARPAGIESEQVEWQADGFDLQAALNATHGPIIEIGGPTVGGYKLLDNGVSLPREPIITNIVTYQEAEKDSKIEMLVDGNNMPFQNDSIGVLLASAITLVNERQLGITDLATQNYHPDTVPREFFQRPVIIQEASRILEVGGLLVWEGGKSDDERSAIESGLELVQKITKRTHGVFRDKPVDGKSYKYVFRKQAVAY